MAILGRRIRVLIVDTIGTATVPIQTPDAFAIDLDTGVPRIGVGRMYVHGLLVENHGKARPDRLRPGLSHLEFDPVLSELRGAEPVPYTEQRYFPNVESVAPFPTTGGPHLVYLDVWQRAVTGFEDPDLLDVALGGPDTSVREQTVWQVRVLRDVGEGVTCDSPDSALNGWTTITSPSAGRLTTGAAGLSAKKDPRLVPPGGGYAGVEDRLFRVQIHDAGTAGAATFKWSKDGAAGAASVVRIPDPTTLVVGHPHRERIAGFSPGDWIEVIDDWREFAGLPGVMAQIANVDEGIQAITLTAAIPDGVFDADKRGHPDHGRHTRIRRWEGPGAIPVPDGWVELEDGIGVTFSAGSEASYRTGDYWSFPARSADASVEWLTEAPPQGIHHHFARLALVTLPVDVQSCRTFWPPKCE